MCVAVASGVGVLGGHAFHGARGSTSRDNVDNVPGTIPHTYTRGEWFGSCCQRCHGDAPGGWGQAAILPLGNCSAPPPHRDRHPPTLTAAGTATHRTKLPRWTEVIAGFERTPGTPLCGFFGYAILTSSRRTNERKASRPAHSTIHGDCTIRLHRHAEFPSVSCSTPRAADSESRPQVVFIFRRGLPCPRCRLWPRRQEP